jgi:S-adenosylmethionine:tRNA ribosyltransferase-isomerase
MFKTADYDFDLPDELIAQYPSEKRDQSRLLVLDRKTEQLTDAKFPSIVDHFSAGDCLVINNTKVIPARLKTIKVETGAQIEVFLLKPLGDNRWEALTKPVKKAKIGTLLKIGNCEMTVVADNLELGTRVVEINYDGNLDDFLQREGNQPLPPYIKRAAEESDKSRYQTIYAEHKGAVAAPTAGLHFTEAILNELAQKGVEIVPITLHVGLGTFRPVAVDSIKEHHMHDEFYDIPPASAAKISHAKAAGKRVFCVGTTSVRTLESAANAAGELVTLSAWTNKFIFPGYTFRLVDCLITNFHTPASTLLMLVSAFAGYDFTKKAYAHAVAERYRFFSYGDSMLIK